MADMMTFPDTWEEFEELYHITDTEQIYTNGARLIPSFRVEQWLEHMEDSKMSGIPTSSENPNNCETCKNWDIVNDHCYFIQECHYEPKTEPQTDYERGRQDAWDIAQKVFDSTVTLYEAEDVAKQIDKTEPQTDIEIARAIVHKAIDDTPIAEDAYPDLRQKMHDAVDSYEPQIIACPIQEEDADYARWLYEDEPQTDCAWGKGE